MLSKCESEVMSAVYDLCDGTESCLVSHLDIMSVLPAKRHYSLDELEEILFNLKNDGYFDLILSERKGEKMYVINLKESASAFKRQKNQRTRDIGFKIFLAFIGAVATFVFGLILKAIFGG